MHKSIRALALVLLASLALVSSVNAQAVANGKVTTAAPTYATNTSQPLSLETDGDLRVSIPGGATVTPTNPIGLAYTDRTITSASGASQQMMAANASRRLLNIQNSGNANCGVNPTGGTAAIGGAGTLTIVPGGSWTPKVPPVSAVTVICTAGQPIYGSEG